MTHKKLFQGKAHKYIFSSPFINNKISQNNYSKNFNIPYWG